MRTAALRRARPESRACLVVRKAKINNMAVYDFMLFETILTDKDDFLGHETKLDL